MDGSNPVSVADAACGAVPDPISWFGVLTNVVSEGLVPYSNHPSVPDPFGFTDPKTCAPVGVTLVGPRSNLRGGRSIPRGGMMHRGHLVRIMGH